VAAAADSAAAAHREVGDMNLKRLLRHWFTTDLTRRRAFPTHVLNVIEQQIRESEKHHGGEIRFAIETALDGPALWQEISAREHAIDVFAQLRVWDTEHNNGVLILVLLADRDVEIVADRGYRGRVSDGAWEGVCRTMEAEFRARRFETGATKGIQAITSIIAPLFPPQPRDANELPDRPALL
jgi:uncharacterized membrane protein YgcG